MIFVVRYGSSIPKGACIINTTSRSTNWSVGLSPFYLGPVNLYDGYVSNNVENGWQYSKCYKEHIDENGNVKPEYWKWAKKGWSKSYADRYPMGKGKKPLFSLWDGERLSYIEARKKIYIPLYSNSVRETSAYERLNEEYKKHVDIYLVDFDAYDHRSMGMSYSDVINCDSMKMGHAFVLAMMLEGEL